MYPQVLPHDLNIEDLVASIKRSKNKPVYLTHKYISTIQKDVLFKFPNTKEYVKVTALKLFLSSLTDHNTCIESKNINGKIFRCFDLSIPSEYQISVPLRKDEFICDDRKYLSEQNHFWAEWSFLYPYSPTLSLSKGHFIRLYDEDENNLPNELKKFVDEYPEKNFYFTGKKPEVLYKGIRFAVSTPIVNPLKKITSWHLGTLIKNEGQEKTQTLHPPGQYNTNEVSFVENFNRFTLVKSKYNHLCVSCFGNNNCCKYIAVYDKNGDINHICQICFKEASVQWNQLLENF